ncbi:MAG TPA: hypothetical protein VIH21_07650 [Dehalococcoidia bacterium]|jgi:hypothetical protein
MLLSIGSRYQDKIIDGGREAQFLILLSFLVTFVIVRLLTHAIRRGTKLPLVHDRSAGGRHLHHLVFGIVLLLVVGYVAVAFDTSTGWQRLFAVLYGIGAALTLDEFALWLDLEDVYWSPQGRLSIDAVVVFGAIAGILALGAPFFLGIISDALP